MKQKIISISLFSFCLFIIDRASKYLALNKLPSYGVYFFEKIIYLKLEKNLGIAFGIALPKIFIITLTIIIIFLLFYFFIKYYKKQNNLICLLILIVIIGAISNLLDRLFHGYVIDFINISIIPVFNLADFYIFVSMVIYIILEFKHKKTPLEESKGVS